MSRTASKGLTPKSKLVKIGKIATLTGISVQALRYYQQRGLISPYQQPDTGYRLFSTDIVERILFIQRCQGIGFSLEEILELLNLQADPDVSAAVVKAKIDERINTVEQKIAELQALRLSLVQLSDGCTGEGLIGNCPIINKLWQ